MYVTRSIADLSLMSALLLGVLGGQGCSTVANDDSGGDGGSPNNWPSPYDKNGFVIRCQLAEEPVPTTGEEGPSEGYTV